MATIDPRTAPAAIRAHLEAARQRVDAELDRRLAIPASLAAGDPERRLREAIRYATLGGGKRLRPALTLAAADAFGAADAPALAAAAAVEMLHAYTLVHDDLPAMDDDNSRRGRPTVHIAFDQAIAILAGDALLTEAFAALADLGAEAARAVAALAAAAGPGALLAGQARDLAAGDRLAELELEEIERIHRGKTGALFAASVELGGIAAGAPDEVCRRLRAYGGAIGVAFQHADDVDDDEVAGRADRARRRRRELAGEALEHIEPLGPAALLLADLARWIADA